LTTDRLVRTGLTVPGQHTDKSRKLAPYNWLPFTEMMIKAPNTNSWWAGGNFNGANQQLASFKQLQNSGLYQYCNQIQSQNNEGRDQWSSPSWGFRNDETDSDKCWLSRIATDRQVYEGHTGCASLIGNACGNYPGSNHRNLWIEGNTHSYRCLTSGSEPLDYQVSSSTYYEIYVR